MEYSIEISGLSKEFIPSRDIRRILLRPFEKQEPVSAVNNITLNIKRGELFCFVGPNGAGKTTLLKILSCLIIPTSGSVNICGYDIMRQELKAKTSIGLISADERSFYWRLTLRQNLVFFAALHNIIGSESRIRIKELACLLGIAPYLGRRFQECSSGIKQRLAIVRAMLNDPPVLLMDEPTKSLDPLTAKNLRVFIKEMLAKEQKKTVVFVSHNLSEVEDFADRIAIMYKGMIKACGTVPELRQATNSPRARLEELYDKVVNGNDVAA